MSDSMNFGSAPPAEGGTKSMTRGQKLLDEYISSGPAQAEGSAACASCAAGTFAPTAGATECSACAAGTSAGREGMSACEPCAMGRVVH